MKLSYKQYSTVGRPLIILHGLFGQQGNWAVHAKAFAENFKVYGFDVRNHGKSLHADSMSYQEMAEDVVQMMDALGISNADFIGHSMGGKIAMRLALNSPERVNKLVVVDIAPVIYDSGPNQELTALLKINLASVTNRKQVDALLREDVPSKAIRDFLLTNLQRNSESEFQWRMNLPIISKDYSKLINWESGGGGKKGHTKFLGETLFVKGELSSYLLPEYSDKTLAQFPKAKVKVISNAGHWVHNAKPEQFFKIVQLFLLG
ncbi:MAG: alpha/beta hydrolase [SAR86 cluster bacterium]|uniref:Alpha/beta hydrolase n=1 Tax=SAR86 cluster bacterium TaxID=2030880 RepID=A0A2A5CGR3_9GAMM|nr:MAG: alpha/beta hydrolase [SAR86 cluster bacterium]